MQRRSLIQSLLTWMSCCGGTLGSILSTSIPAMTVDLGVPILAMHSSRELMARSSQLAMDQFAEAFFK